MGIGHSSGFCIGHWILFCTVMDGGVASDKLSCSLSCLVFSSAAGPLFNPEFLMYLWCCLFAQQSHGEGVCFPGCEGSLWFDLLRGMWERTASDFAAQCSFIQYQTNKMHPCVFVAEKVKSRQWRSQVLFLFLFFQNLGLKFRVTVHQSFPLTKHKR